MMDGKALLAWFVAPLSLIFFIIGILMVGGSIYYLDCSRISGQVDCQVSTKFLGTFKTEVRQASNVKGARQGMHCDQGDCRYRLQLNTDSGVVPFSNDYSFESKTPEVDQILAFLADQGEETLRMTVFYWRGFIFSALLALIGLIGLVWSGIQFRKPSGEPVEQPEVIEPGGGEHHPSPGSLPLPSNLDLERQPSRLRFTFRNPSWKGLLWLLIGLAFAGLVWIFIAPGETILETAIMYLVFIFSTSNWNIDDPVGFHPIMIAISIICAPIFIYFGLGTLLNRMSIQVTYDELWVRELPLPSQRTRRLRAADIQQLYVSAQEVAAKKRTITRYSLHAVMKDNRQVVLASDFPYDLLHYLEVHIESWLRLKDRRVVGEASPVDTAGMLEERKTQVIPGPEMQVASETQENTSPHVIKRSRRVIPWVLGLGCSIPVLCVVAVVLLASFGKLSGTPGDVNENPVWSPDGSRIAFDSNRDGNHDVYLMDPDGSEVVQLTRNPYALPLALTMIETSLDGRPAWSPSGDQLAFVSARDNGMMTYIDYDIFCMDSQCRDIRNLSRFSGVELRPAWSPDGSRLVFESDRDPTRQESTAQQNWDIYLMRSDGSELLRLTHEPSNEAEAVWSPDGSRIAFISDRDGSYDLYTMSSNGSSIEKLTDDSSSEEEPAWSPDGSRIAFISDRDGDWDIYLLHLDHSMIQKLTTGSSNDTNPSWSPDGSRIVFTSDRDGDLDIYVMNVDGSQIVQLTGR